MRLSPIVVTSVSALALALIACASESPPAGSKSTAAKTEPAPKKGGDTSAGAAGAASSGGESPSGDQTPAGNCGSTTTSDECWECCHETLPEATRIELARKWQQCACAPTTCATACANDYCKSAPDAEPADATCEACLSDKTTSCDEATEADPAYAPVAACASANQCEEKPDEQD